MRVANSNQTATGLEHLLGEGATGRVRVLRFVDQNPVVLQHTQIALQRQVNHVVVVDDLKVQVRAVQDDLRHGDHLIHAGVLRQVLVETEVRDHVLPRAVRDQGQRRAERTEAALLRHGDDADDSARQFTQVFTAALDDVVDDLGDLRGVHAQSVASAVGEAQLLVTGRVEGRSEDALATGDALLEFLRHLRVVGTEEDIAGHQVQTLHDGSGLASASDGFNEGIAFAGFNPVEEALLLDGGGEGHVSGSPCAVDNKC